MRTNFTGRMNRDAYYDGGGGGYYSSPEHTEQPYVDQRGWREKLWDKTPIWLKAFVVLFILCFGATCLVLGVTIIHRYVSFEIMGIGLFLGVLYSAIYSAIKNPL